MRNATPPHEDNLHLAYATDKGYLFLETVSARSAIACASRPQNLIIHLLDCGLDDTDWARFETCLHEGDPAVTVVRHVIDLKAYDGFALWRGNLAAYARLSLPLILPDEEKCFYADCDTIFVDDSLLLLECFDSSVAVQGYLCWDNGEAANDTSGGNIHNYTWICTNVSRAAANRYVNSGFLWMNLTWWREHNVSQQCFDFLLKNTPPTADETAINVVCQDALGALPQGWGVPFGVAFANGSPHSIHYIAAAPHKARFHRFWGFSDATAIWMNCVKALFGLSVHQACGIPQWKWCLGRLYNHLVHVYVTCFAWLPWSFGRELVRWNKGTFAGLRHRKLLSKKFWKKR